MSTTSPQQTISIGSPKPFFQLLDFGYSDRHEYRSAIARLRQRDLTGIVIRGVYEEQQMADVTAKLERHEPAFVRTDFPEEFRSWFYGRNLNLMGTDPLTYFRQASEFHSQLDQLLSGDQSLRKKVPGLLADIDDGRPYLAAPGPEPGMDYMMTTLRGHAEGGYIPAHCDNEQSIRPSYEHLQTLVDSHMYSAVLMIGEPDSGGDLQVYDHCVESAESHEHTGAWAGKTNVDDLSSVEISLRAGDVIVVDSGRYLHRVTPVVGQRTRWVACSFMARALDRNSVYCWG